MAPHRTRPTVLGLLLLMTVIMSGVTGCNITEERVDPDYDLRGADVFVVPFKHGYDWHYESKTGNRLGQTLEVALANDCGGLKTIRNKPVQGEIRTDLSDKIDWLSYGQRVGCQYLIVGEIDKITYENPRLVGMLQGYLTGRYEVWDMKEGRRTYTRQLQVRFPGDPDSGEVFISFEQSRTEIENALLATTAKEIAKHLCGYVRDKGPR